MKRFRILLVFVLTAMPAASQAQEIWTIGPMLHINFGGDKRSTSFAIEGAYWNLNKFYHSVDFAIEFDRGRVRIYSEAQTGIGLTGISLGPVIEFHAGHGTHIGIQGTCWINYFLGADYRIRFIDKKRFHAVGIYGKLPIATTGLDDDNGSSGWGDWDSDWD